MSRTVFCARLKKKALDWRFNSTQESWVNAFMTTSAKKLGKSGKASRPC